MSEQGWLFLTGIVVASVSYLLKNFILDQIIIYRRTIGRIRNRVRYFSDIITNDELPIDITKPVKKELRQLSCDLDESYYSIPFIKLLHKICFMPSPAFIDMAASRLIFLSNNTGRRNSVESNHKAIEVIEDKLNIRVV